jgi:hypothetical protein
MMMKSALPFRSFTIKIRELRKKHAHCAALVGHLQELIEAFSLIKPAGEASL